MSFSLEVKQEIAENKPVRVRFKKAQAYGLFLFGKSYGEKEISLHTECGEAADLFAWFAQGLLGKKTPVALETASRRGKTVYTAALPQKEDRLRLLELLGGGAAFNPALFGEGEETGAFLAGAFLACGSIADPEKSYHLEFVVRDEALYGELSGLLERYIPGVKGTIRRGARVAYYKECAQIEDLLTFMGASKASLTMIDVEMIKNVRNRANRVTNCETANIDKLVVAASSQVEDIRLILDTVGEESLPDNLREVARLRLENPDLSLRELAEALPTPISRSGMHHRLDKLSKIAAEIRGRGERE